MNIIANITDVIIIIIIIIIININASIATSRG